ncbi:6124_t:CDS:2, partial [Paraglomus brasilianum]
FRDVFTHKVPFDMEIDDDANDIQIIPFISSISSQLNELNDKLADEQIEEYFQSKARRCLHYTLSYNQFVRFVTRKCITRFFLHPNRQKTLHRQSICSLLTSIHSHLLLSLSRSHRAAIHDYSALSTILDIYHDVLKHYRAYLEVEDEETNDHAGSQLIIGNYWAWIKTISDWIQASHNEWRGDDYLVIVPCLTVLVDIIKLKLLMSELDVDDLETIEAIDSILDVVNNNLPKICTLMTFPHITAIRRLLELILLTIKSTDNASVISLLLSALTPYTNYLTSVLTSSTFSALTSPTEYTEFFLSQRQYDNPAFIPYDAECLKRVIIIYMRSVEVFCDKFENDTDEYATNEDIENGIRCVLDAIEGLPSDQTVVEHVFRLFNNNDADMFDIMLSMTKLAIKKTQKKLERNQGNCKKGENVNRFLDMMVELREATESLMRRQLFPYNARSLVQRIVSVEEALMM